MKRFRTVLMGLVAGLVFASCATSSGHAHAGGDSDDAELERSLELGDEILASFRAGDYPRMLKSLPGPMQTKLTEADFKSTCSDCQDTLGEISDYEYAFELDTPAVRNLIWRVGFEREDSEGEPVAQDMLFRLVTGTVDGEVKVLSCGFL